MPRKRFVKYGGVCESTAGVVKLALTMGYDQHIIAGYYGDNQGRVSEVKTGKRWSHVATASDLPPDFPGAT